MRKAFWEHELNIVFFSTNSNFFDSRQIEDKVLPSCKSQWESLAKEFPEHSFFVATQMPGSFLIDTESEAFEKSPAGVKYVCLIKETVDDIAAEILELKPDVVISASFWVTPYDWLPIKDSLIAEKLLESGIQTVCVPSEKTAICFDKWQTHHFLEKAGFNVPKAVYVHHGMFWCERGHKEIKTNVYKEHVLSQIKKLNFPVIIKDTVGLSSYGAEVVPTYKAAAAYLQSHKNSSDRIVEEYINGVQFGTEIHGGNGFYNVLPPFMFSVNQYGITSPKQSVKIGPVVNSKYSMDELTGILILLANEINFSGIIQLDLVFSEGKWYVLEINPRLSGMSQLYAALQNKSIYKILLEIALNQNTMQMPENTKGEGKVLANIKMPLITNEQINSVYELPFIEYIHQIHNLAATQKRETGYCEVIISGKDFKELSVNIKELEKRFPSLTEPAFIEKAQQMLSEM